MTDPMWWLVPVPGSLSRTQVHAFPTPDQEPLTALCGRQVDRSQVEKTSEGAVCERCLLAHANALKAAGSLLATPNANPVLGPLLRDLDQLPPASSTTAPGLAPAGPRWPVRCPPAHRPPRTPPHRGADSTPHHPPASGTDPGQPTPGMRTA
ncbi:hypothetical protein [Longimycelium tulufanense]|uniref:hypothetical protein n=1 Tax=Longimycelium tulufanense TaxID=907463 RepID=UPI001667228F|nr:hypothetical protein [Longimycelium tulufanense]